MLERTSLDLIIQMWQQVWAQPLPEEAAHAQGMMGMLGALGAGFDCASPAEIDAVLALGVPPERIIYAHPVKSPSQVLSWVAPRIVVLLGTDQCIHREWHTLVSKAIA